MLTIGQISSERKEQQHIEIEIEKKNQRNMTDSHVMLPYDNLTYK